MINQVQLRRFFVGAISSSAGIGYIPIVPATWASAIAALVCWWAGGSSIYWLIGLSLAGLWVCKPSQQLFNSKDPKQFVMDETCGMMLSLVWLPREVSIYIGAFILFRLLDIIKPWPICLIQQSKRPTSILWDDLAAGVAVNAILQVVVRVF